MGNQFLQEGTMATGNIVGTGGSAVGTLTVANVGIGYTPLDGNHTFPGVNLVTYSGTGRGATADIYIANGVKHLLQPLLVVEQDTL